MAAIEINNLNDFLATMLSVGADFQRRQTIFLHRESLTTSAAAVATPFWRIPGFPGAGALPATGAGTAYSRTTPGALPLDNASGGGELRLVNATGGINQLAGAMLYDRLVACRGLAGNSNSLQQIDSGNGTVALPARAGTGEDVELWLEIIDATGTGTPTVTINYVNQDGDNASTSDTIVVGSVSSIAQVIALAPGDTGIRKVTSIQFGTAMSLAGDVGVTLRKPLCLLPQADSQGAILCDVLDLGLPPIPDDACLEVLAMFGTTPLNAAHVKLDVVEVMP